jgi:hypothetical protein
VSLNFQQNVERPFNRKILTMQSDWGGEYQKLHSFFQKIDISLVLMHINKMARPNTNIGTLWKLDFLY